VSRPDDPSDGSDYSNGRTNDEEYNSLREKLRRLCSRRSRIPHTMTNPIELRSCPLCSPRASPDTGGDENSLGRTTQTHISRLGCGQTNSAAFLAFMARTSRFLCSVIGFGTPSVVKRYQTWMLYLTRLFSLDGQEWVVKTRCVTSSCSLFLREAGRHSARLLRLCTITVFIH
jgi:hypothetical protein